MLVLKFGHWDDRKFSKHVLDLAALRNALPSHVPGKGIEMFPVK